MALSNYQTTDPGHKDMVSRYDSASVSVTVISQVMYFPPCVESASVRLDAFHLTLSGPRLLARWRVQALSTRDRSARGGVFFCLYSACRRDRVGFPGQPWHRMDTEEAHRVWLQDPDRPTATLTASSLNRNITADNIITFKSIYTRCQAS